MSTPEPGRSPRRAAFAGAALAFSSLLAPFAFADDEKKDKEQDKKQEAKKDDKDKKAEESKKDDKPKDKDKDDKPKGEKAEEKKEKPKEVPKFTGDEKQAIAAIEKAGGKVYRDEAKPDKPVVAVNYATTGVGDEALPPIVALAKVTKVTLNGTKITDTGLGHVKDVPALEKLYMVDTKVGDEGVERLKDAKGLKILSLVGTQVTDKSLDAIKEMPALEEVFLAGTKVSDDAVKKLKESKKKLKVDR